MSQYSTSNAFENHDLILKGLQWFDKNPLFLLLRYLGNI